MWNNNSDFTKNIIWYQELLILNIKSYYFQEFNRRKTSCVLFLPAGVINNRKSGPADVTLRFDIRNGKVMDFFFFFSLRQPGKKKLLISLQQRYYCSIFSITLGKF